MGFKMKKSKGFGDTVEKLAKATGLNKISEVVSKVTGKDCGCGNRKKKLNKLFPYKNK